MMAFGDAYPSADEYSFGRGQLSGCFFVYFYSKTFVTLTGREAILFVERHLDERVEEYHKDRGLWM